MGAPLSSVPLGLAVFDFDLVAEIFAEESDHFGFEILDAGLEVVVEIFAGLVGAGDGLVGLGEAEAIGFVAIDILDVMAAAPAPWSPGNAEVLVDAQPEVEIGFEADNAFKRDVGFAFGFDFLDADEALAGKFVEDIGIEALFAIGKTVGGFGVDIEDEAETFFAADILDGAGVFGIDGAEALSDGFFAHELDELGAGTDF